MIELRYLLSETRSDNAGNRLRGTGSRDILFWLIPVFSFAGVK